jgi:hypothetical protein
MSSAVVVPPKQGGRKMMLGDWLHYRQTLLDTCQPRSGSGL